VSREVQRRQQMMDESQPVGTGKMKQDSVPEGTKAPKYPKAKAPAGEFKPPKGKDPRVRAKNDNVPPAGKPLGKKPSWLQTPDSKPPEPPMPPRGKKPRK
jgi:hypothetical protein